MIAFLKKYFKSTENLPDLNYISNFEFVLSQLQKGRVPDISSLELPEEFIIAYNNVTVSNRLTFQKQTSSSVESTEEIIDVSIEELDEDDSFLDFFEEDDSLNDDDDSSDLLRL